MRMKIFLTSHCPVVGLLFYVDYLLIITYSKTFACVTVDIFRPLGLGLFMNTYFFLIMMV